MVSDKKKIISQFKRIGEYSVKDLEFLYRNFLIKNRTHHSLNKKINKITNVDVNSANVNNSKTKVQRTFNDGKVENRKRQTKKNMK